MQIKNYIWLLITLCSVFVLIPSANAALVSLDYIDSGWYTESGTHGSANENHITGYCVSPSCLSRQGEYRSFFVFDLSGISGTIDSATLRIHNNAYFSSDPSELLEIVDVSTPINTLRAGGTGLVGIFNDLGTGQVYGTRVVSDADDFSIIEIMLNQMALDDLNNANGLFGFGGHLTTISGSSRQYVFGGSGNTGSGDLRQLILETHEPTLIPEPSSLLLLSLSGLSLFFRRKS